MTSEQVVQWAREAEKLARAACKEMPGMEYRAAEAFALITLSRADLEAELESLRKDAERFNWLLDNHSYFYSMQPDSPSECGIDLQWHQGTYEERNMSVTEVIDAAIAAAPARAHSAMKEK